MENILFDSKRIAEGYARRPWLHKQVMERLALDCGVKDKFQNGLDVGCGGGLSAKALKLICNKVTGCDASEAMIEVCRELYDEAGYTFYVSKAEETKTPIEKYDIVTAAGVINWIDKDKFLCNMHEVMTPGGLLVIYDFGISDSMLGSSVYTSWYRDCYLQKFPKPPRKETVWKEAELGKAFTMQSQNSYQLQYEFDMLSFIEFMMIQSNVNVQIESGKIKAEEVKEWMQLTLQPIFKGKKQTLIFEGYSWYIRHLEVSKKEMEE